MVGWSLGKAALLARKVVVNIGEMGLNEEVLRLTWSCNCNAGLWNVKG